MPDIAVVTAKLDSETKGFEQGYDRAISKSTQLERQTRETEEAVSGLGKMGVEAMEGLHESIAELAEGFAVVTLAAGAVEKTLELVKDLAAEMVTNAAAAQMIGVQFKAAFGSSSEEVGEWAEKTGEALGRSQDDLMKVATAARVMVGGLGVGGEAADSMAEALAKMATQMSIAKGIPLDQAMQALNAGMHGAGRGLYEFGIALNKTTQDQKALQLGLGDTYATLTQAQQAQVNFNIVTDGAGKLAQDAAAATGTYANQVTSLKSAWEEMTGHLGRDALPALTTVVETTHAAVKAFDGARDSIKGAILAGVAFGPMSAAVEDLARRAKDAWAAIRGDKSGSTGAPGEDDEAAFAKGNELVRAQIREKASAEAEENAKNLKAAQALLDQQELSAKEREDVQKSYAALVKAQRDAESREVAALDAKKLKDLHELIAEEERADAARIKAQADIAAAQKAADQDHIKDAQEALAEAEKRLSGANGAGGAYSGIQQAQAAVTQAYDLVQGSIALAIKHTQAELDAHNKEIAEDLTRIGKDADIQRLKQANIELEKDLSQEQRELLKAREAQAERDHARFMEAKALQDSALGQVGGKALTDAAATAGAALSGNPAAATKAGLDLLGDSKGGKDMEAAAQAVIQRLVDTIGEILEPIVPVIQEIGAMLEMVLKPLGAILGQIGAALVMPLHIFIQAIQPLFLMVGQLLTAIGPIVGPVAQIAAMFGMLAEIGLLPLIVAVQMLEPVIEGVTFGIKAVVDAISGVWNGIVGALQSVLNDLASISVFGGHPFAFLGDLANDMNGAKIDVGGFSSAVVGATATMVQYDAALQALYSDAQKQLNDSAAQQQKAEALQEDVAGAQQRVDQYGASSIDSRTGQTYGAELDAFKKALAQAQAAYWNAVDQSAVDTATASGNKDDLANAMYGQILDGMTYNSAATAANTAVTAALNASMTNVPAMFKVAQVVDQITSGQWNGGSTGGTRFGTDPGGLPRKNALDSRIAAVVNHTGDVYSGVVVNGDMHFTVANDQVFEDIKRRLTREKVTRTGTQPRDLTSRHALAGIG